MTNLRRLHDEQGQSPWLDNLTRSYLRDGTPARFVDDGISGVTSNPTIFAKAIEGSDAYDEQCLALTAAGITVDDACWDLVVADVRDALALLRPTFDAGAGSNGFVSIEVAPEWARDTDGTTELRACGAHRQRTLWASTSTKNPAYADTLYVDNLIGPDTINTLPKTTIAAFEDHGNVARTIDRDVNHAAEITKTHALVGVDMDDVGLTLEDQGISSFHESFSHVLDTLTSKAHQLASR